MEAVPRALHQTGFCPGQAKHHVWLGPSHVPQEEAHDQHPPPPPSPYRPVSVQEIVGLGIALGGCAMEMGRLVSLAIDWR